jgi:hypothetical protein
MSKFKEGDIVIIINEGDESGGGSFYKVGDIGMVENISYNNSAFVNFNVRHTGSIGPYRIDENKCWNVDENKCWNVSEGDYIHANFIKSPLWRLMNE